MKILQTVVVKQVLTETSKQQLYEKFQSEKLLLQKEIGQINFEMKKIEKSMKSTSQSLASRLQQEVATRNEKLKLLDFKIEQLHMLPLGSELKEKEIQALVEVNVGDKWEDVLTGKIMIVKDGVIDEIRNVRGDIHGEMV